MINDVRTDVAALDKSPANLKKFGWMVGGVFALIGVVLWVLGGGSFLAYMLLGIGLALIAGGLLIPAQLRGIYIVWMILAIGIGWFVSRLLTLILYYLVLTPIGLLARLCGQRFLKIHSAPEEKSAWISKKKRDASHFEKMY